MWQGLFHLRARKIHTTFSQEISSKTASVRGLCRSTRGSFTCASSDRGESSRIQPNNPNLLRKGMRAIHSLSWSVWCLRQVWRRREPRTPAGAHGAFLSRELYLQGPAAPCQDSYQNTPERRTSSPTSLVAYSNPSARTFTAALQERHPGLPRGPERGRSLRSSCGLLIR